MGEKVLIVFQNHYSSGGVCEQHPWHMHDHTFYVVGEGTDQYDPISAIPIIHQNIVQKRTQFRDVVTLFQDRSDDRTDFGTPCGWVAIRFIANNPGALFTKKSYPKFSLRTFYTNSDWTKTDKIS